MFPDFLDSNASEGTISFCWTNTCIGDDSVDTGDIVLRLEKRYCFLRVRFRSAVNLDDDEIAVGAFWQIIEGFGCCIGVTDSSDNFTMWAGKVRRNETMTDTCNSGTWSENSV